MKRYKSPNMFKKLATSCVLVLAIQSASARAIRPTSVMEHARLSSLLVIALLQLTQTEISSTLPESWYAANVISDGAYSPRPLSEIFSTESTFLSTNPIVVLPSSTTPSSIISTSNIPSTLGTKTENPATEVSVIPLSTERTVQPLPTITVPSQPPPLPSIFVSATEGLPAQPPQAQLPTLSQFQQPPAAPQLPPIPSTPQQVQIQTAQQISPLPAGLLPNIPNIPPNYFLLFPQMGQPIQNFPPSTSVPVTSITPPSVTSTLLSSVSTQAPCANVTPTSVPSVNSQFPTFKIRMVAPSGSITSVRINSNPTISSTTTRRPVSTRSRRKNRNNYDGCVNGCGGNKQPICASPSGVSPIDPDNLKGFPSVCHMACHNSFRKIIYEKVADGKCGRLRTRIRPIDESKLKKDDLNKATYTIVQDGPSVVEFSPLSY